MTVDTVALRVQGLDPRERTLVLSRIAEDRADSGRFSPGEIERLFVELGLPLPPKVSNLLASLERDELIARSPGRGAVWRLTPRGNRKSFDLIDDVEVAVLAAEMAHFGASTLGKSHHPIVPPSLAPPDLLQSIRPFIVEHPFETNVFGITRFPAGDTADPVGLALDAARAACADHRLEFHLAKDRSISDDLWTNVAAHMWSSKFGISFFENRSLVGLNYNLTIEVGAMLMTGRRCLILKDTSVDRLPTDLVGRIYREIDLDDVNSVISAIHTWLCADLNFGSCRNCASR